MNVLKFLANVLLYLLKVLAYQWAIEGAGIVKRLIAFFKKFCIWLKLPHADREDQVRDPCKVSNPAFHRPDPCIYSQQYLLSLGLPVTWDNPDIVLRRNGVIVAENDLLPNTDYEIGATNAAYRTTPGSGDLRRADFVDSAGRLERIARDLKPRWIGLVGKEAYRGAFGERPELGVQERRLGETQLFVLPSTSPANAAVPWDERLHWFRELAELSKG